MHSRSPDGVRPRGHASSSTIRAGLGVAHLASQLHVLLRHRLLRQPHGLEGLGTVHVIRAARRDLAVAERQTLCDPRLSNSAPLTSATHERRQTTTNPAALDESPSPPHEARPKSSSQPLEAPAHPVMHRRDGADFLDRADSTSGSELNSRKRPTSRRVKRLESARDDLHVLLRHRPPSIPDRTPAAARRFTGWSRAFLVLGSRRERCPPTGRRERWSVATLRGPGSSPVPSAKSRLSLSRTGTICWPAVNTARRSRPEAKRQPARRCYSYQHMAEPSVPAKHVAVSDPSPGMSNRVWTLGGMNDDAVGEQLSASRDEGAGGDIRARQRPVHDVRPQESGHVEGRERLVLDVGAS